MCRLLQRHAASFFAGTEAVAGAELPHFVKDEFDAFLECGIGMRARESRLFGSQRLRSSGTHRASSAPECGVQAT